MQLTATGYGKLTNFAVRRCRKGCRRLQRLTSALLGRALITDSQMLTWMPCPTSVIGGKADMAQTCQYVR
jgi:hypothetical protein